MAKTISILGSTGSIGLQTLDVARNLDIKVAGLAANSSIDILEKQAKKFSPRCVAVGDDNLAEELYNRLKDYKIKVFSGLEGIKRIAAMSEADTIVNAIVGIAGLVPTMEAIRNGKNVALANKETLVTGGEIVMTEVQKNKVELFPIDSEHSAIFQCMMGNNRSDVEKIILTASGGPFRGRTFNQLKHISVEDALKHPNWNMGAKITIDSATLMNKGLEVIEAKWLFELPYKKIEVLIHPQSIIHSMVEYIDGSVIAQLGAPDMRVPIQLALTCPSRYKNNFDKLDLLKVKNLSFEKPDYETFYCLRLAYEALKEGGTMPVVLNAANEVAVSLFLERKIEFYKIPQIIEDIMERHNKNKCTNIEIILEADQWARKEIKEMFTG